MSRRAQPYVAGVREDCDLIAPVGSRPTMATRNHFGYDAMRGLVTWGSKHAKVPIQHPYSGQGANFPAFPHFTGSSVAPDMITPALLVARNLYSPSGHSNPLTSVVPPQAQYPRARQRPPQTQSGRPSGAYTLPHPPMGTWWPTNQQWLADRMRAGQQQSPSGWQGHGGK